MNVEGDQYGKRALDFVQRLPQPTHYDEVCRHITAELEWFGFGWVTSFSIPGPGCQLKDGILLNNLPEEYVDRYAEKNYVIHDPVVKELRRNMNPYSWGDVREGRDLKKSERAIIDEAREFGARDGLIIPIVELSGSILRDGRAESDRPRDPNAAGQDRQHARSVNLMDNSLLAEAQDERIPERDILAMLAMIDYLIAEIGRIDPMSAQCLVLARKSLAEAVGDSLVKAH